MGWRNNKYNYGSLSIGLHWVMLLLLVGVYVFIELRVIYPKGSDPREAMKAWHFMLGLSVLFLVLVRLVARWVGTQPQIEPTPANWQKSLAKLMHFTLYVFMIAMPLGGWLILSAAGKPIPFFGLELPPLIDKDKSLSKLIKEIHETGGVVGYYLIGFHAAAALFHHYVVRDNTLRRILPKWRKSHDHS